MGRDRVLGKGVDILRNSMTAYQALWKCNEYVMQSEMKACAQKQR